MTELHHFKTAFVAHHSKHDFSELAKLADSIVFCSTGYEQEDGLASAIESAMKDFNPRTDVLVPVGNVNSNMLMGAIAARKCISGFKDPSVGSFDPCTILDVVPLPQILWTSMFVAIYSAGTYHIREVRLGGSNG